MIKKILRELYMLSRGEQRGVILLSLLLIFSVLIRLIVQILPYHDPPGMQEFVKESQAIIASIQKKDSLRNLSPAPPHSSTSFTAHRSPTIIESININRADSAMLLPLPGIGPVFAGRIIKYRNLLGGFKGIDQLHEVYGMKEETIQMIRKYITIDTTAIKKILLDSASFRNLLRHPYLQLEDVKLLLEYRDFRGGIGSLQEIRENELLSDSTLQKVGPYFRFNDDDAQK